MQAYGCWAYGSLTNKTSDWHLKSYIRQAQIRGIGHFTFFRFTPRPVPHHCVRPVPHHHISTSTVHTTIFWPVPHHHVSTSTTPLCFDQYHITMFRPVPHHHVSTSITPPRFDQYHTTTYQPVPHHHNSTSTTSLRFDQYCCWGSRKCLGA